MLIVNGNDWVHLKVLNQYLCVIVQYDEMKINKFSFCSPASFFFCIKIFKQTKKNETVKALKILSCYLIFQKKEKEILNKKLLRKIKVQINKMLSNCHHSLSISNIRNKNFFFCSHCSITNIRYSFRMISMILFLCFCFWPSILKIN